MRRFIISTAIAAALQVLVLVSLPSLWPSAGRLFFELFYFLPFSALVALYTKPHGADGDLGPLFLGSMIVGTFVYSALLGFFTTCGPGLRKRIAKP